MDIVRPYDLQALTVGDHQRIYLFALDQHQDSVVIRIEDFHPYVFVELPPFDIHGNDIIWTEWVIDDFVNSFKDDLEGLLVGYQPITGKRLYYYQPEAMGYLQLFLTTQSALQLRKLVKRLEQVYTFHPSGANRQSAMDQQLTGQSCVQACYRVYELNIKPTTKFLASLDVSPCDPLDLSELTPIKHTETDPRFVAREYRLTVEQFRQAHRRATQQSPPMIHPRILVFDIECYSSSPNRMPQRYEITDEIFAISCTLMTGPGASQEYMLTTGVSRELEGLTTIRLPDELSLLKRFLDLITELNPQVISGYNIHGFDLQYFHERLSKIYLERYPSLALLKWYGVDEAIEAQRSGSDTRAFGHMETFTIPMIGRIYFDLYTYMRKNYKFPKYSLDHVAEQLLDSHKEDMPYKEMFAIFRRFKELTGSEVSGDVQASEVQSNIDDFTRVVSYCVQDSRLVVQMLDKLHIWIELLETANIVQVPIEHLYLRGQQARCVNQVYKLAHRRGYVIDQRVHPEVPYTGGFVGEPVVGLHDQVACLDFASLYPSIIMAYNICYTTLIAPRDLSDDPQGELHDLSQEVVISHDEDLEIRTVGTRASSLHTSTKSRMVDLRYRFVRKDHHPGLLPELVSTLVSVRRAVRKQSEQAFAKAKELADTDHQAAQRWQLEGIVLHKRQLALKVSANSLYGFLGVQNGGQLPLIEGAMSITALGRQLINGVNRQIETHWGYQVVYNDTDSTMFVIHDVPKERVYERAEELATEINKGFQEPLRMELEKVMIGFFLKKKNYCYLVYKRDGTLPTRVGSDGVAQLSTKDIVFKGMKPVRRENCQLLKDLYSTVILQVFQRAKFQDVAELLLRTYERLMLGQVPVEQLVMYLSLGEYSASSTYYLKSFKERVINQGYNVNTGDRVEVVLVKRGPRAKVADQLVLLEEFEKGGLKIDGLVYLVKKIAPAIDQILAVAYQRIIQQYPRLRVRRDRERVFTHAVMVGAVMGKVFLTADPNTGLAMTREFYDRILTMVGDIASF